MRFYCGTHEERWLGLVADGPLMVSDTRLRDRKTLPVALDEWVLDSGGFTELQKHGGWISTTPREYVDRVRHYASEIGGLVWAAPQDWMCEPVVIAGGQVGPITFVGTGLSVREHQDRTVANLLELRDLAADLPIMPVLQGWQVGDYLRCAQMYLDAGIDLTSEPIVGVGSVCRRQSSRDAAEIFATLHDQLPGIRMHGFGVKTEGLGRYGDLLASADSCSWSKAAEHEPPLPGCTHQHCQNCLRYALRWRDRVLAVAAEQARRPRGIQLSLDMSAA